MSDLEEKVAAQLAKINAEDESYDSTSDESIDDNTSIDDDSTESSDTISEDETTPIVNDEENKENKQDETSDGDSKTIENTNKSDIPDAYVRAAVHQGWKQEEVEKFWKDDKEKAEKTLSKILESTNRLSTQWGQLGQQQMMTQPPTTKPTDSFETPAEKDSDSKSFEGLDISKLKTEYDDDNLIDDVIKPLNDLLVNMKTELDSVKTQQTETSQGINFQKQNVQEEKNNAIGQQIDQFFSSPELKSFEKHYGVGSDWAKFEGEQANNRLKMLTLADQIKAGAAYQSEKISNEEAMSLAHMSLTSHIAEQMIIDRIRNSLTKREKSLSLKPSGSRNSPVDEKEKSAKDIEKTVGAFMKKRKIKQY